jgi:predicted nucleic acid-binding protein
VAENELAPPIVVCDAGPLIHLDEVGCVELLADFPQVLVPLAVWDEVAKHRPSALTTGVVRFQKVTPGKALSTELDVLSRLLGLHRGEQEALQIAQAQPSCLVLTDDTAAGADRTQDGTGPYPRLRAGNRVDLCAAGGGRAAARL